MLAVRKLRNPLLGSFRHVEPIMRLCWANIESYLGHIWLIKGLCTKKIQTHPNTVLVMERLEVAACVDLVLPCWAQNSPCWATSLGLHRSMHLPICCVLLSHIEPTLGHVEPMLHLREAHFGPCCGPKCHVDLKLTNSADFIVLLRKHAQRKQTTVQSYLTSIWGTTLGVSTEGYLFGFPLVHI